MWTWPVDEHLKCGLSDLYFVSIWSFTSDALANLVGQQNARYGIIKIFNALQEASANKHLLYVRIICIMSNNILNYIICNYSRKHNYFVSLSPSGIDGNVTEGSVPWTQRGGGQHLNTTHMSLNTHRVFGSFRPLCSWPIINCQARQGDGLQVKPQTESSCVGQNWDTCWNDEQLGWHQTERGRCLTLLRYRSKLVCLNGEKPHRVWLLPI